MSKYLLIRLSAMGDVAMTLPLIYAVARAHPEHEFTLLTQPFFTGLLTSPPDNLEAMAIDIRQEARSLGGLLRYIDRLKQERFDVVLDLHDVLRTKLIRWSYLTHTKTSIYRLRKPRRERKLLLQAAIQSKPLPTVPHMLDLYKATLQKAGLSIPSQLSKLEPIADKCLAMLSEAEGRFPIGIAPFASTDAKTYDLKLMQEVVRKLSQGERCQIYLFGSRGKEASTLEEWQGKYSYTTIVAGKLDLPDELALMQRLRCLVSMDSANMHLASAVGTPVVSVWCSTHPQAGFLGWAQKDTDILQDETLDCRPCSIFGQVHRCTKGDMPCRRGINPERIVDRVESYIREQ